MRVVLIHCSGRKRERGARSATAAAHVKPLLTPPAWQSLVAARCDLASQLGLPLGPDLDDAHGGEIELRPAYDRYDGNLYRKAYLDHARVSNPTSRVLIVSALYGVIDARDDIRNYNLAMTDTLANRTKVSRFWRERGLPRLLADAARALGAVEVHDFLSTAYRDAARGLQQLLPDGCSYVPHHYPGLGTGSDYHRGADVNSFFEHLPA